VIGFADALRYAASCEAFARARLGFEPDPWQAKAMTAQGPTLLNCSRQSGKSTTTAAIACHEAVHVPDALVLVIAPTQRQSSLLFKKVSRFLKSLNDPVEELVEDNKQSCTLKSGAQVFALPGDPDTLRGFSAPTLVILDEAAFLPEGMVEAVLPMLAVSDGRLMALSTPNGRQGYFYEAWHDLEADWTRIRVPATDCPRIKPSFLERMRRKMPEYKFRQEFFCEFADTDNQIFGSELIDAAISADVKPLFSQQQLIDMGAIAA